MGRSAHSPHLLVSVWLYAYTKGIHSARAIVRQAEYEPCFEWLTGLRPIIAIKPDITAPRPSSRSGSAHHSR